MKCLLAALAITFMVSYTGVMYSVPEGFYKKSCRNIEMEGSTLKAECKKKNGMWRETQLKKVNECKKDVYNKNGRLKCKKR